MISSVDERSFPLTRFIKSIKKFVLHEENATMVEYGLLLALIAIVCVTTIGLIGTTLNTKFNTVKTSINP